jgi:hypothetical protein
MARQGIYEQREAHSLEAATRDLPRDGAYWDAGYDWIAAERAARRPGR